jgi:Lamin Tail Domain/PKD domain
MKTKLFLLPIISVLNLFLISNASALQITEIQFDPAGTDADREWIEVCNDEVSTINLTNYKLFESSGNRAINAQSGTSVAPGEYAILVQEYAKFTADYPSFSGKLFRASFSLVNTGEPLELRTAGGAVVDNYTYNPTVTGSGNGLSEQKVGAVWGKGLPTPGVANVLDTGTSNSGTGTTTATSTSSTTTIIATITPASVTNIVYVTKITWPSSEKIYVNAGENKIALTGSEVVFNGRVLDSDKKSMSGGEYNWSFGDGFSKSGNRDAKHVYLFPGEYTAVLEVSNGEKIEEDRVYVKVLDPEIKISIGKEKDINFVELTNNNNEEIKLGGMTLKEIGEASTTMKAFTFPKNFSILPKRGIKIVNEATLFSDNIKELGLYYNTGKSMSSYVNPNYKIVNINASTTAIDSTIATNSQDPASTSLNISTATKKYIKNYVKTYTQNLKDNASTSASVSENIKATTSTTTKTIISRENKSMWQAIKNALGL